MCRWVRRTSASPAASPASDLPPAWACRSRYRATARGLIGNTVNPAPANATTSRFLSVSMATGVSSGVPPVLGDQLHQGGEPAHAPADPRPGDNLAVGVDQGNVMVAFGPVDPTGDRHVLPPSNRVIGRALGSGGGDLMEALEARHLTSRVPPSRPAGSPSTLRPRSSR